LSDVESERVLKGEKTMITDTVEDEREEILARVLMQDEDDEDDEDDWDDEDDEDDDT
jgi:hypothetical protein